MLSITRKVSLQWPAAVREFLAVTNSLSYSVSSFISLDCSLDHTSAVPVSVQVRRWRTPRWGCAYWWCARLLARSTALVL